MNISRQEAGEALQEIGRTADRVHELCGYRHAAPHLIIWGAVWMIANFASEWRPAAADTIWLVLTCLGVAASVAAGVFTHRQVAGDAGETRRRRQRGLRFLLSFCAFFAFQFLSSYLLRSHVTSRSFNAQLYLLVAMAYVLLGVWIGSRIAWLGVLLAAATMCGFIFLPEYFSLWMGFIGGGMLLGTGLWLRRA